MARGLVGDSNPQVFIVEITRLEIVTWSFYDLHKKHCVAVVRPTKDWNEPRIIEEWKQHAIECEITPAYFNRIFLRRSPKETYEVSE